MCGNGIRCYAQFLKDLGADQKSYRINTLAGLIIPEMKEDGNICVDMVRREFLPVLLFRRSIFRRSIFRRYTYRFLKGEPILDGPTVPTTLAPNSEGNSVLEQVHTCNGKEWKISMVSMGNPHAIIFVDDLEKDIDFEKDGPALESDTSVFPAKTNVEFVQVMSPTHLKMKVSSLQLNIPIPFRLPQMCFVRVCFSHHDVGVGTGSGPNLGLWYRYLRPGCCGHPGRENPSARQGRCAGNTARRRLVH